MIGALDCADDVEAAISARQGDQSLAHSAGSAGDGDVNILRGHVLPSGPLKRTLRGPYAEIPNILIIESRSSSTGIGALTSFPWGSVRGARSWTLFMSTPV